MMWSQQLKHAMPTHRKPKGKGDPQIWPMGRTAHTIGMGIRLALLTGREAVAQSDLPPSSMALLCMSLTLSLVIQLASCMPPTRLSYALENTVEISEAGPSFDVRAFDEAGNQVEHFIQPSSYVDADENVYRCVNPHVVFSEGTFTQDDLANPLDVDTVKRCAMAEKWCADNIDQNKSDIVTQLFIWRIIAVTGLYDQYDQSIVSWKVDGIDIDQRFAEFQSWFDQNEHGYEGTGVYWANDRFDQDVMSFSVEAKETVGKLMIRKTSTQPQISDNNAVYSLEGARYGIWKDEGCSVPATDTELVCGPDGVSNSIELPSGTYYVKEASAPSGFLLSDHAYPAIIEEGKPTMLEVRDDPIFQVVDVWARKITENSSDSEGQGPSLAGCKACITFYAGYFENDLIPSDATPLRTWVLESDEHGDFHVPESIKNSFFVVDGKVVCPLGTVAIQETVAPEGYWLEGQTGLEINGYEAPTHVVAVHGDGDYEAPAIVDNVFRSGITIHKADAQTKGVPQGDATLEGITFEVINRADHNVCVDGATFGPNEVVATLITDDQGKAETRENLLPTGTYAIRETKANQSYLLSTDELTVTLSADDAGKTVHVGTIEDHVIRGGIRIGKVSRETLRRTPQGAATLANAQFDVTLVSKHPVVVGGSTCQPNTTVCTLMTNEQGVCETDAHMLPYGTYRISEIAEPNGYLLNKEWSTTVEIRADGVIVDLTGDDASVPEQVQRRDLNFTKVEKDTGQPLSNIPFLIRSVTTGESHIAITNERGVLDTSLNPHTRLTNGNDNALGVSGEIVESMLDPNAGLWFSGTKDTPTQPTDTMGALPYDIYHVTELRVGKNEDKHLVEFDVNLTKGAAKLDKGIVENERILHPEIDTALVLRDAMPKTRYTFVDTVAYMDLTPGQSYALVGTLVSGDAATDNNKSRVLATSSHSFVPRDTAGTEEVVFEFEGDLSGVTVVALETLQDAGGNVICTHEDLKDTLQTTRIPAISTKLTDRNGRKDAFVSDGTLILVDSVSCENLESGQRYTLEGTLTYKDGKGEVKDAHGSPITGHANFEAKGSHETVEVVFDIHNPSLVEGKTIVAFEKLCQGNVCLTTHADTNDEAQTINVPKISSVLADETGSHVVPNASKVKLVDTLTYAGLTPGVTYEVFGSLVDRRTSETVAGGSHSNASPHVSFRAAAATGEEKVTFEIDTSNLGGRELVAFESLVRDSVEVARHADINDTLQTVSVPVISTELTDSSGSHKTKVSDHLTLNDTVSYAGLEANKTYTVTGTLMDATTGKQVTGKDGRPVEATQQFSAVKGNGSVNVPLSFDASGLGGKRVVAFETISEGAGTAGRVLATHADLKSTPQTVELTFTEGQDTTPAIIANASYTPPANTTTPNVPLTQTQTSTSPVTGTSPIQAASTSTPTVGTTTTTTSASLPHTYDSSRAPAAILVTGLALVALSVATKFRLDHLIHIRHRRPRHMRARLKRSRTR